MKRAGLLLVLITLVIWLAQAAPAEAGIEANKQSTAPTSNLAPSAVALPQGSCCANPGETDPHWECFDGACVQVYGCGQSVNCATCGCSSTDEWVCINNGGYWDSYSCSCEYGCDPSGSQQSACLSQGGYWDSFSCVCDYGCDPTGSQQQACIDAGRQWDQATCTCTQTNVCVCDEEELVGYDEYTYAYCDGYYYVYCTDSYYTYYQYCDGTCGPRQWTETDSYCYSYGEYCGGGGGGGGGGGSCWDSGDCWCDDWWGICCEYDYCYDMEFYYVE